MRNEELPSKIFVTTRPVAVLMLFLAAVVLGVLSYKRLPITLMPDLSYPTLTVRTEYPGAAPEEVENDVTRRIEESVGVVGGLRRMSSTSRAGVSDVVLEFSWDTAMADAIQETLEKLDLVLLPTQAERPLILRYDPTLDPVLELSLSGEGERFQGEAGLRRLRRIADLQVKRALEPIPGVAAVRPRGGLEEEIHVLLDAQKMARSRISVRQVIDRLERENVNVAGGQLQEGRTEFLVRTVNEYSSLEQIAETVMATVGGRDVRISDLGRVVRSHRDREIVTRVNGHESVGLEIFKEADANMVALAKRVRARVGLLEEAAEQPSPQSEDDARASGGGAARRPQTLAAELYEAEGVKLEVVADRSLFIEASLDDVRSTVLFGGLLAILVLYLFLKHLPPTLIVALSIPISVAVTFAPLNALGVSLNIMSLGGLALGIGMLVDSSIVVLESIYRCREEGDDLTTSVVRGTREVRSAVVSSILTSIAVFFPLVFVEGVAGQAFGDLALAVVISLLASMIVALLFIPMLASRPGLKLRDMATVEPRFRGWAAFERFKSDLDRSRAWRDDGPWRRRLSPVVLPWFCLRFAVGSVLELVLKSASFRRFRSDLDRSRAWRYDGPWRRRLSPLVLLWPSLRLVVGSVLELVLKSMADVLMALLWVGRRTLWPALVWSFRILSRQPVAVADRALGSLATAYPRLLGWGLRRPAAVLLGMAVALGIGGWLGSRLGTELLPEVRQGEVTFEVELPVGTPLDENLRRLAPVETAIRQQGFPISNLLVTYGYDVSTSRSSDEGEHTARFKLLFDDLSPAEEDRVVGDVRSLFLDLPDVSVRVTRPVLFSFKSPVEVEVHGEDLTSLTDYAHRVQETLASMDELVDVETTQRAGAPEVQIVYDRERMASYELSLADVAQLVRSQVQGEEATLFNLKDRRVPIIVRLEEGDRRSAADLEELLVNPSSERPIRLGAIADIRPGEGPSEVRRVDGRRVALVRANLGEASLGEAVTKIREVLNRQIEWPSHMAFRVSGQSEEWENSRSSLWLALALSVFLVYVIMAAQFESLIQPFIILVSIPLALFGTMITLYAFEVPLSIVAFLGMILLAGIVVNNAIVLVDYINTLRSRGLGLREAILSAGSVRLRPILMTTATTVLGLLPMALGLGQGAEIRTPMALAVIGGLVASTALTLVVIPVLYLLFENLRRRLTSPVENETSERVASGLPLEPGGLS